MTVNNPFIYDDSKVTKEQAKTIRYNNMKLLSVISNLKMLNTDDPNAFSKLSLLMPNQISRASNGTYMRNPENMDVTICNKKIQALMRELAENRVYPEYRDPDTNKPLTARQIYFSSFFYQNMVSFYIGDTYKKEPTQWGDYKRTSLPIPDYIPSPKNSLGAALSLYAVGGNKIGLDLNRMLDTILISDGKGGFKLHLNNTFDTNNLLSDAVDYQIGILKENAIFKSLYLPKEKGLDDSERY